MIRPKLHDCDSAAGEILLISKIFVRHQKHFEARCLGDIKQISIAQSAPTHFLRRAYLMAIQCPADLNRHTLVEQHPHAASSCSMRVCPWRNAAAAWSRFTDGKVSRK